MLVATLLARSDIVHGLKLKSNLISRSANETSRLLSAGTTSDSRMAMVTLLVYHAMGTGQMAASNNLQVAMASVSWDHAKRAVIFRVASNSYALTPTMAVANADSTRISVSVCPAAHGLDYSSAPLLVTAHVRNKLPGHFGAHAGEGFVVGVQPHDIFENACWLPAEELQRWHGALLSIQRYSRGLRAQSFTQPSEAPDEHTASDGAAPLTRRYDNGCWRIPTEHLQVACGQITVWLRIPHIAPYALKFRTDHARCSMWNETDLGELVWDERLDAADPDAQLAFLRACTEPLQRAASLHIKPGAAPLCPLSAFDEWLGGRNQSLPLTRAEFESLLPTFLELRPEWTPFISLDGTRLRHLVVQYTLVVQRHANAAQRRVLYERWEAEVAQLNAAAPQAVGAPVQSAGVYWMTMVVQVRAPNTPPPAPGLIFCLVQLLYEYPTWRCQLALS